MVGSTTDPISIAHMVVVMDDVHNTRGIVSVARSAVSISVIVMNIVAVPMVILAFNQKSKS